MTDISRTAHGRNSELRFHPLADIFPLMEGEAFDELVADIKANGLVDPIVIFDDMILDGRNRYRACQAASVTPTFRLAVQSPEEKPNLARPLITDPLAYVISANIRRRHLTAEQKRDLIARLLTADPSKSDRQIAKTVKASPTFVGKVRAEGEATGDVSTVDTRTDTKGRQQPATKARGWSRERYKTHRARKGIATRAVMEVDGRVLGLQLVEATADWLLDRQPSDLVEAALTIVSRMSEAQRREFSERLKQAYPDASADATTSAPAAPDDGLDIPECLRRAP
jgi:ParB-like chromosome segregation protein Spo0J